MLVEGRRLHWEFGRLSRAISVSKGFGNLTYIVIMFSLLEFTLMSDLLSHNARCWKYGAFEMIDF